MSKILRISTELESDPDSKNGMTSLSRSRASVYVYYSDPLSTCSRHAILGFSPARSLLQSPCKASNTTLTSEAMEGDIGSRRRVRCAETVSVKSIIESIVSNYEGLQ